MLNLDGLNPQQRLAVETTNGPVLILAGAGTGKTRVITHRVAYLLSKGIAAENVLAVTFTNKAAREMQERLKGLLPRRSQATAEKAGPKGPTICTFHSLGARLLRQHIERLGYKKNFVIYDQAEQLGVVKKILSHISARGEKLDPQAILGAIGRTKFGREFAAGDNPDSALARHILPRYESALRACNAVDFEDLLGLTLRLFRDFPQVLAACREQFRFVMVDEYQDTNATQFELLHLLTREHRNLCVVGDDDQSIYAWRGAEVANLLDMEKHYPEVRVIKLEQNYRSTNTILQAANALIKHNLRRRSKQLWSGKGQGSRILIQSFRNEEEEARSLVEQINFSRLSQRKRWSDHAILFRTNQQSRAFEMALRHADIPYVLVGGQSYFDRREVRDLMAYLKLIQNPHDDVSLLRIANVPARGLSDVTMQRLLAASQQRRGSVFSAMSDPAVQAEFVSRTGQCIADFVRLVEDARAELQTLAAAALGRWAEKFLHVTGYLEELRRSEKQPEMAESRIRNVKELVESLPGDGGSAPGPRQLETFLEELTLDRDREEESEDVDAVTLITIHSCKGLEFEHVFVAGVEDGLLPHAQSKLEGNADEERRLFYVAITRAKQALSLSYCLGRKRHGQAVPCHPSPFLTELPSDLLDHADARAKVPVSTETGKSLFSALRAAIE